LALLVGINSYNSPIFEDLSCCEADAESMSIMLANHAPLDGAGKGPGNYATKTSTSKGAKPITTEHLRQSVNQLMSHPMGDGQVLFYFSGHGLANDEGGYLVTQDATAEAPGYPMSELLEAANVSGNTSVVIILDCCHSGEIGNITDGEGFNRVSIGPNVTVLAGSGASQKSAEGFDNSLFTELLLEALDGGASDIRGEVSAAAIYAYLEKSLGAWDQRPVYKSYARKLEPIRRCVPDVPDAVLAGLTEWFRSPRSSYTMDPSYECTHETADEAKIAIFDQFKLLRNARLLTTPIDSKTGKEKDLYYVALDSDAVSLTPQGRLFWKRAKRDEFWG
jgi:hypothetical protein